MGLFFLSWAHHPSSGLFILGPPPSGARRLVYPGTVPQQCNPWRPPRSPKQKQQPGRGSPNTQKEQQTKEPQKGGAGSQPTQTLSLEPKWFEPKSPKCVRASWDAARPLPPRLQTPTSNGWRLSSSSCWMRVSPRPRRRSRAALRQDNTVKAPRTRPGGDCRVYTLLRSSSARSSRGGGLAWLALWQAPRPGPQQAGQQALQQVPCAPQWQQRRHGPAEGPWGQ